MKRLILEREGERQRRLNIPVARLPVQKNVLAVGRVFRQVQVPDAAVILDKNLGSRIAGAARSERQEVPHLAWFSSFAWAGQLNLYEKMVTLRGMAVLKGKPEAEKQILRIWPDTARECKGINWKLLVGLRFRRMLISEGVEAMISAHEEIIARDMGGVVKRWPVAYYRLCKRIPNQLNGMVNRPPGCECSLMNLLLLQLRCRTLKFALRLLFVIALAVHVIEGQVSNGAPTIRNQNGWLEARHSSIYRSSSYAKIRKNSESRKRCVSHFLVSVSHFHSAEPHHLGMLWECLRRMESCNGVY